MQSSLKDSLVDCYGERNSDKGDYLPRCEFLEN